MSARADPRRRISVVRRSAAQEACGDCGEITAPGLNRCDRCGTVYEHTEAGTGGV